LIITAGGAAKYASLKPSVRACRTRT